MGIYRQFPYSNFHEMNLDWLLNTWKEFSAQFESWKDDVDAAIEEFRKYLEDLHIDDYVQEVLNQWFEDGVFTDIINSLAMPQRELIIAREGRYNSIAPNVLGSQGIFYDGSYLFFSGNDNPPGNDTQVITRCNLNGDVLDTHSFTELSHAGSIAADDSYIYVAPVFKSPLYIIDKNTWDIVATVENEESATITAVSIADGVVYALGNDKTTPTGILNFCRLSDDHTSLDLMHQFTRPINDTYQNMMVYGNTIYILWNNGTQIYSYDLQTGVKGKAYNVPDGDGFFSTGEVEDMTVINGAIYLLGVDYYRYSTDYNFMCNQIFKTNLIVETVVENENPMSYMAAQSRLALTVDPAGDFEFNPRTAFTTLEEACMVANYHRSGEITCSGLTEGYAQLLNGSYKIICTGTGNVITKVYAADADVKVDSILGMTIGSIATIHANLYIHKATITTSINVQYSELTFDKINLGTLPALATAKSIFNFNNIDAVNPNLSVNNQYSGQSVVNIFSLAVDNILKLAAIGAGGSFTFWGGSTGQVGFRLTQTMLLNQAIDTTIGSVHIVYADGSFTSGVSATTLIEIKSLMTA